jgi:hypothetical protein
LYAPDILKLPDAAPYKDAAFLRQKYVTEGLSIKQISSQIFSSKDAVRRGLIRAGIKIREPHKGHGRVAQPRYGQKLQNGKVAEHLTEKRVVRAILDLRTQGLSLRQIAKFLIQMKVSTKRRGKAWHPEMVKRILEVNNHMERWADPEQITSGFKIEDEPLLEDSCLFNPKMLGRG